MALIVRNSSAIAGDVKRHGFGKSSGGGHGNPVSILAWRITWTEEPGWLLNFSFQMY